MKTQIDLLSALPVRILKPITSTRTVSKADMLADLAFNLDFHGIEVTESVLDSDFLVFKFNGEKVGAIDVRRGRQEFQLPSAEWSTEWDKFFVYLIIQKRAIAARLESVKPKAVTQQEADELVERAVHADYTVIEVPGVLTDEYALIDEEEGTADIIESHFVNTQQSRLTVRTVTADEAYEWASDKMQDDYEDSTDPSLSPAEHVLKQRYPNSADRIIETLDETFEVGTEGNILTIRDNESGTIVLAEHNHETQTWKAYLTNGEFYAVTHKPVQWLTHIANYRN